MLVPSYAKDNSQGYRNDNIIKNFYEIVSHSIYAGRPDS